MNFLTVTNRTDGAVRIFAEKEAVTEYFTWPPDPFECEAL